MPLVDALLMEVVATLGAAEGDVVDHGTHVFVAYGTFAVDGFAVLLEALTEEGGMRAKEVFVHGEVSATASYPEAHHITT